MQTVPSLNITCTEVRPRVCISVEVLGLAHADDAHSQHHLH